jgi:hypothetical protein
VASVSPNPRKCPIPFSHTTGGAGNFLSRSDPGTLSHRPPEVRGLRLTAATRVLGPSSAGRAANRQTSWPASRPARQIRISQKER